MNKILRNVLEIIFLILFDAPFLSRRHYKTSIVAPFGGSV